jgi:predicted MFS family arabinose efflux permease
MGDSLLYGVLPLAASSLGIPLPLVGVLLSANRLVRLISNTWVSRIFERVGPRAPFIVATVIGFVTTLLYGVGWGFLTFLVARIGWGIAWSGLRQGGYQAVWAGDQHRTGRLMGLMWGIFRLGSAISVVIGGYLWDHYGFRTAVAVIAGFTALAIPVALALRWPASPIEAKRSPSGSTWHGWRLLLRHSLQRWMLLSGLLKLVFNSILVSTAALFLASRLGTENALAALGLGIGTVAGIVLALRWISDLALGPALGSVSDRLGQARMAVLLSAGIFAGILGAVAFRGIPSLLCLSLVLILNTGLNVTLDAAASRIALTTERPHLFVGLYTTASDAGSAVGPLLAYSLGGIAGITSLYVLGATALALTVIRFWRCDRQAVRQA